MSDKPNSEGTVIINKIGHLICERCLTEMEPLYAKYVCPKCKLTVGTETYDRLLKRYIDEFGTPELRYPV